MAPELPIPPHFARERLGEVWRVLYEERAGDAVAWAREHEVGRADDDSFRICLVTIDVQNTFCTPGFELVVPGAVDDNGRLCEFVYRNLGAITRIVPTLDTHQVMQIFHALWLVDEDGNHPAPYTLVPADEIERGTWKLNPAAARSLGLDEDYASRHLAHYVRALERGGKFALTIWPYHALIGGIGHALVSAVEEAIFFHSVARESQPDFQVKGRNPLTEHYSMLGPEVTEGPDGERIAEKNTAFVEHLLGYDAVVVAGQAKSHCVAWTIEDLLAGTGGDRELAAKIYLLEDCSSPVVVPGAVDYTEDANAAFARFADAGMHVVRSTESIGTWPGMQNRAAAA
jgi:nicotinamidase-related amidase